MNLGGGLDEGNARTALLSTLLSALLSNIASGAADSNCCCAVMRDITSSMRTSAIANRGLREPPSRAS